MERYLHRLFYEIEDTHWWSLGVRKIQLSLLRRYLNIKKPKILDIGCGTGATLKELSQLGSTIGIDKSQTALDYCKRRGLTNVLKADLNKLPFTDKVFHCLTLFDTLEHVKNDISALQEVYRVLKLNGLVIITSPAFMFLWDDHDRMNHHYRRYTKTELQQKLHITGFTILYISYYNTFLFPLVVLSKWLNRVLQRKRIYNNQRTIAPLNTVLYKIFSLENIFLQHIRFPFGVSLICVAQKTGINRRRI